VDGVTVSPDYYVITNLDNGHLPVIDISNVHLPPYLTNAAGALLPDPRPAANERFDARVAAVVRAAVGPHLGSPFDYHSAFLETKDFPRLGLTDGLQADLIAAWAPLSGDPLLGEALSFMISEIGDPIWEGLPGIEVFGSTTGGKAVAAMAYQDFFPSDASANSLRGSVSQAILSASPGWCGTLGPGIAGLVPLAASGLVPDAFKAQIEGNYDMGQMFLVALAYRYYDELTPDAQEHLIRQLLAEGHLRRPNESGSFEHTSGGCPNDWARCGHLQLATAAPDIPETENHVLMIATARYLSNQLLYQRDPSNGTFNNRANGDSSDSRPNCTDQILTLLQRMLMADFAEYNAKSYQEETRWALLNLNDFAYDDEVRLAARMVLDYISARMAVSTDDARRMVPFRRRNEDPYTHRFSDGFLDVGLLNEWDSGSDPMPPYFALLSGNTRGYESRNTSVWPGEDLGPARNWPWVMASHPELTLAALSDYRLPPSIHDLFLNDLHRRFFQRLHRTLRPRLILVWDPFRQAYVWEPDPLDRAFTGPDAWRNCDNLEIYAGSPSYLITAGGRSAGHAYTGFLPSVFEVVAPSKSGENLGVAVSTSFIPTSLSAGQSLEGSKDLIQFTGFWAGEDGGHESYGVAPDFACGYGLRLPDWATQNAEWDNPFFFINRGPDRRNDNGRPEFAGFYLAIFRDGDFAVLEAFDTLLHTDVSFVQFKTSVLALNRNLVLRDNQPAQYTTQNGNTVHFVIWRSSQQDNDSVGAKILGIDYGAGDPSDTLIGAGNDASPFLSGTVLTSSGDGLVQIKNPYQDTQIILELRDPDAAGHWHPRRAVVQSGQVIEYDEAGNNHEVWVDFGWTGLQEGNFFRPFNTVSSAVQAVADAGVIKIMPGSTSEAPAVTGSKGFRLVAPIGGVRIGVASRGPQSSSGTTRSPLGNSRKPQGT
jgi:hypothetical protein